MTRTLLSVSILLLVASSAWGQNRLPFTAEGAVSLRNADESCDVFIVDGSTAAQHSYFVRRCDLVPNATQGFGWHFYWVPTMPSSGTIVVKLEAIAVGGNANICIEVALGCSVSGSPDVTYAAVTKASVTLNTATFTTLSGSLAVPSSPANSFCFWRVRRIIGDGTCTDSATVTEARIRGGWLEW